MSEDEIEKIKRERDMLIGQLSSFGVGDDEKRFIIKKINIITEKLLEKMRYTKKDSSE